MLGRGGKAKVGLGSECNPVSKASVALTRTVKRVAHRCGGEKPYLDRAALSRRVRSVVCVVRPAPLGRSGKPNHNSLKSFGRTVIDIKTSSYMCLDDADHLNA